jgi:hypothetical protein
LQKKEVAILGYASKLVNKVVCAAYAFRGPESKRERGRQDGAAMHTWMIDWWWVIEGKCAWYVIVVG